MTTSINLSSIKDNHKHGSVGQFLIDNLKPHADLSVVSAYFTIYAYNHLKAQLEQISHLKFLFGEPTFIKSLDPAKTNKRDFKIEDDKIVIPIQSRLTQKAIAKDCAEWIRHYLVTWNCAHIANGEVIKKLMQINSSFGITTPVICTPEELMPTMKGE